MLNIAIRYTLLHAVVVSDTVPLETHVFTYTWEHEIFIVLFMVLDREKQIAWYNSLECSVNMICCNACNYV